MILIALAVGVDGVAGPAARHRVHAQSERGHATLHADHAAHFPSPRQPNCCRCRTGIIRAFPEVEFGSTESRAATAAGFRADREFETIINLKPKPNGEG